MRFVVSTLAIVILGICLPGRTAAQTTPTIEVTGAGFNPQTVTIPVGGRVRFINEDAFPHEVQPDPHPNHQGGCDEIKFVGFLVPGDSAETDVFPTVRDCGFHDHQNPHLTGTIRVVASTSPTNPSGSGAASPSTVAPGATTLLTVTVTPGTNPASTGLTVNADLSPIGGVAGQQFFNDGTNGDATANDSTFSFRATVSASATVGGKTLGFDVNDAQGRRGSGSISLTVQLADSDGDGLPDTWEQFYGLNATSDVGADGDPDGDTRTNLQEFQGGTHPRNVASLTRYFAEGATSSFFDDYIALANPDSTAAAVLLRFLKSDGTVVTHTAAVPALARRTVTVKQVSGMSAAEFSTVIETDRQIVADRTMRWNASGYGSHTETGIASPATTWYFAEGATHSGFSLFYLLQNPNASSVAVTVTYLRPAPAPPLTKVYTVAANSRFTIWVNDEATRDGALAGLASADVSATITAAQPIIAERAMYLDSGGQTFGAGHESAGVTATSTQWFLAEGATGSYFDLFILVSNPSAQPAEVTATYLLPDGTAIPKRYTVAANSRFNIWVDSEDARLADTAVSTTFRSTNGVGIIVERAMWWPGGVSTWHEAHNSPGATTTGTRWTVADGEVNTATETYVLIANTSAMAGSVKVTLLFEDGAAPAERTFSVPANSRFNVAIAAELPAAAGRRFGALVESQGASPAQIVVERATYSNAAGVRWAAGANALATKLQ